MVPELDGVPAARHEGACASGSLAILAAMEDIEAGRYDCVLVVGAEQERNVPGELAARHLGSAAWIGHAAEGAFVSVPQKRGFRRVSHCGRSAK